MKLEERISDGRSDFDRVEELFQLVYADLRRSARHQLRRWRPGQTMNTTALVHEAYIKLADHPELILNDRQHFYSLAARAMRQIVVDYARRLRAAKRGRPEDHLPLDETKVAADDRAAQILDLDRALTRLGAQNERLSQVVELRYFVGLTSDETAEAMDLSRRTVHREWRKARAILFRELSAGSGGAEGQASAPPQ